MKRHLIVAFAVLFAVGCGEGVVDIAGEGNDSAQVDEADDLGSADQALVAGMMDSEEAAFLGLINSYRVSKGLGKLRVSIALNRASEFHSNDMATHNTLSHNSSDGTDFSTRVHRFQPCGGWMGENVAMGYTDAQSVFNGWKASSGHNANMLGTNYKVIGIARVQSSSGAWYWTTDFSDCVDALLSVGFGTIAANGSFEGTNIATGVNFSAVRTLNKWHTFASSGGGASRTTGAAQAGSYGMHCVDPDPGTVAVTQVVKASHGVNYKVSALAKRAAGSTQQVLYLDFLKSDYTRILARTVAAPATSTSTRFSVSETAPSGTAYVRVILYGSGSAGQKSTYNWDDVRVEAW